MLIIAGHRDIPTPSLHHVHEGWEAETTWLSGKMAPIEKPRGDERTPRWDNINPQIHQIYTHEYLNTPIYRRTFLTHRLQHQLTCILMFRPLRQAIRHIHRPPRVKNMAAPSISSASEIKQITD